MKLGTAGALNFASHKCCMHPEGLETSMRANRRASRPFSLLLPRLHIGATCLHAGLLDPAIGHRAVLFGMLSADQLVTTTKALHMRPRAPCVCVCVFNASAHSARASRQGAAASRRCGCWQLLLASLGLLCAPLDGRLAIPISHPPAPAEAMVAASSSAASSVGGHSPSRGAPLVAGDPNRKCRFCRRTQEETPWARSDGFECAECRNFFRRCLTGTREEQQAYKKQLEKECESEAGFNHFIEKTLEPFRRMSDDRRAGYGKTGQRMLK